MARTIIGSRGRPRGRQLLVGLQPLAGLGVEPLEGAAASLRHGALRRGRAQLFEVSGPMGQRGESSGQLPHVSRLHQDRGGRGEELLEAWNRGGDHREPAGLGQAHGRRRELPPTRGEDERIGAAERAGRVQGAPSALELDAKGLGSQGEGRVPGRVGRLEDDAQPGRLSPRGR